MTTVTRISLQQKLFPNGIPRLWCPTLTHFSAPRIPDPDRIAAHLQQLSPCVKGILVPGSTGEGWEMNDEDVRSLLRIVLPNAEKLGLHVLIGILKTDVAQVLATIDALQEFQAHPAVVGFTVCPPKGNDLTQNVITDGLRRILDRGHPTVLYQLPQVTQNEMSAETVSSLAAEFPNFILFKDTSGVDRVANAGLDLDGVFLVRGSESGGYARWLKEAGGRYDGFLLSTANVLAFELHQMISMLESGQTESARRLSEQIESLVTKAFERVRDVAVGNAFTNANKLLYHLRTYGEQAPNHALPMLYSGYRLPSSLVTDGQDLRDSWPRSSESGS